MKSDDLIHILCRLTSRYFDFEDEETTCTYEYQGRAYEMLFKRVNGKFVSFSVRDIGEVIKCES
jgi:hypothetical protein